MENNLYDNMIQVLAYFADQCDMFTPMLDGVKELKQENDSLRIEVEHTRIISNRLQLEATFNADYANFSVNTVLTANKDGKSKSMSKTTEKNKKNDLYILFKSVINVGRENYNKLDMEYKLDFYFMNDVIEMDAYFELLEIMTKHAEAK